MTDGQFTADVGRYSQAAVADVMPAAISSDPLIGGATPIEQMLRMLGLAANSGDPEDNALSVDGHARRTAATSATAEAFAAQDALAADNVADVVPRDQTAAGAARELPQLIAGISAAVSGGLSGILQPLGQLPQQIAQGAQQVLQAGAGLSPAAGIVDDDEFGGGDDASLSDELFGEDLGFTADDFDSAAPPDGAGVDIAGGGGGLGPGIAGGGAAPGVMLAAPATPSAATHPASAPGAPAPAPTAHIPAAGPGMAGMPLIPPGGFGSAGVAERDAKADTKRIATPPVRNGAPVQGRITAAPPIITATVEGMPVASRRIVMPSGGQAD